MNVLMYEYIMMELSTFDFFFLIPEHNRDMLERVGFFEKCGKEWLFPSIQDAINHAQEGSKLVSAPLLVGNGSKFMLNATLLTSVRVT